MNNPLYFRTVCGFIAFLFLLGVGFGQSPPPPAAGKGKKSEMPSTRDEESDEIFTSWDGRFSFRTATFVMSGQSPITPKNSGAPMSGRNFNWKANEGEIIVQYFDDLDAKLESYSPDRLQQFLSYTLNSGVQRAKGTDAEEEPTKLGVVPGRKVKFKASGSRVFARSFVDENRVYLLVGAVDPNVKDAEELVERVLNSFQILSQAEIDAIVAKAVDAATPEPLPQLPIAPKLKSDAEDEGLKGKVRSVTEEDKDLSGTWQTQVRHRSSFKEFNENGNLIRDVEFDSTGHPFEITVYGYIDGSRVSRSEVLSSGTGLIVSEVAPEETKKRDLRYDYKLLYKYSAGRLVEEKWIMNDGDLWLTYVYEYNGDRKRELVYSDDGELNQKYEYKLDSKQNPIEYIEFDASENPAKMERTYRYSYDTYDGNGNWVQRTRFEVVKEGSAVREMPSLIEYRTITYYP